MFGAAISATYGIKDKEKKACSFRKITIDGRDIVVYGPANWEVGVRLEPRMWLRKHGFDMSEVDRVERILLEAPRNKEDILLLNSLNEQLLNKSLDLLHDQGKWMYDEISIIKSFHGLSFITDNNLVITLAMWEHMTRRITEGGDFHSDWGKSRKNNMSVIIEFISVFPSWKANSDPTYRNNRELCFDRYAIIAERLRLQ
jgi:hypothetical protein